jgi:hypothetical protein
MDISRYDFHILVNATNTRTINQGSHKKFLDSSDGVIPICAHRKRKTPMSDAKAKPRKNTQRETTLDIGMGLNGKCTILRTTYAR